MLQTVADVLRLNDVPLKMHEAWSSYWQNALSPSSLPLPGRAVRKVTSRPLGFSLSPSTALLSLEV